jgi:hypothetical protein
MNRDYNKKGSLATSIVQPSSTVFSNPVMYLNNGKPIYGHWKIWTMLLLYGIGLKMKKMVPVFWPFSGYPVMKFMG